MRVDFDEIWLDKMEGWTRFNKVEKKRLYRIFMVCAIGVSYLVDTVLFALFALAGTIGWQIVGAYGAAGLGHVALFSTLHWWGYGERFANPHLVLWQMSYAVVAQMAGMAFAPQLAPMFIGIMMVVFAFGVMRINLRTALLFWALSFLGIGLVLALPERPSVGIVDPSRFEVVLLCLTYALIVLRTLLLGYYATAMRTKLYQLNWALGQAKSDAEHRAAHDPLTGAMSRRGILPLIERAISQCARTGQVACVVMIDVDWFKAINDRFGHLAGDQVLKRLVERVRECVREVDRIGRYGGEEFILVLHRADADNGVRLVERIRAAISATDWSDIADGLRVTASCGVTCTRSSDGLEDVLSRADHALYEAKSRGRDRVCAA